MMGRSVYNRNIFKTSLYTYIFQDVKCRLMHNRSLSMPYSITVLKQVSIHVQLILS